jgi:hypothetical protein
MYLAGDVKADPLHVLPVALLACLFEILCIRLGTCFNVKIFKWDCLLWHLESLAAQIGIFCWSSRKSPFSASQLSTPHVSNLQEMH